MKASDSDTYLMYERTVDALYGSAILVLHKSSVDVDATLYMIVLSKCFMVVK